MASGRKIGRICTHAAALTFLVLTVILIAAALFSTFWQQVDIGGNNDLERHDHGLWQYCVKTLRTDEGGRMCLNMHYGKETHQQSGRTNNDKQIHDGQRWRQTTLTLIAAALACSIISTIVGFCAICWRCAGVVYSVFSFLTFVLLAGGVIQFTVNARDEQEMIIHIAGSQYYQKMGWSFVIGCVAAAFAAFSAILAGVSTGLSFTEDRSDYTRGRPKVNSVV